MKRFKGLIVENFQSHERTEITFSEGLNVFVGPSDSGKSAILRALRWVLYNQPRGSDFIRTGASRCRVTLILSDGTQIVRERSSSVNRYLIRDSEGREQIFEGFGSDVPREVLEAHGMVPLQLDEDRELTVQFGQQLEGPFSCRRAGGRGPNRSAASAGLTSWIWRRIRPPRISGRSPPGSVLWKRR